MTRFALDNVEIDYSPGTKLRIVPSNSTVDLIACEEDGASSNHSAVTVIKGQLSITGITVGGLALFTDFSPERLGSI